MVIVKVLLWLSLTVTWILSLDASGTQKTKTKLIPSRTQSYVGRLHPGQDIMTTLTQLLSQHPHKAITMSTATGSVQHCHIRFGTNAFFTRVNGPLEVTSITGTFDRHLNPHLHIAVANTAGNAFGGHLPSLRQRKAQKNSTVPDPFDCPIFTTLEVSLNIHENVIFDRKDDSETGYDELTIFSVPRYYPLFKYGFQNQQIDSLSA